MLHTQLNTGWSPPFLPLPHAHANGSLGVAFSGSGFLVPYLTGVAAVLHSLGVITNTTKLAGASGGAVTSVQACAGASWADVHQANLQLAAACRATDNCRGLLDTILRIGLPAQLSTRSPAACAGRLFVAVTQATGKGAPDTGLLLGPDWSSPEQLVDAAVTSSFIPFISAPSAVTNALARDTPAPAAYDGAFSDPLPSPPGATHTVTVSALAPTPGKPGPDFGSLLATVSALATPNDTTSAPFLPLNPVVVPQTPRPDIFPGLSGSLPMTADAWNKHVLEVPDDDAQLVKIYNQGRRDAAGWAGQASLADAATISSTLRATAV